jgi:catechol 2,3-dioxygenase-like lactoylglutathione lyase family enzyme
MPEYKKAYTTIMVDDMDRAVDFYTRVLGMAEDFRFGDSWAEVTVQGHRIGIHPKKMGHATRESSHIQSNSGAAGNGQGSQVGWIPEGQKTPPHAPTISIGFEVADIRKTAKELEAKGVQFHFQETDVTILAFFKDPDGTYLYLTQVR